MKDHECEVVFTISYNRSIMKQQNNQIIRVLWAKSSPLGHIVPSVHSQSCLSNTSYLSCIMYSKSCNSFNLVVLGLKHLLCESFMDKNSCLEAELISAVKPLQRYQRVKIQALQKKYCICPIKVRLLLQRRLSIQQPNNVVYQHWDYIGISSQKWHSFAFFEL